jgi:hypothetical protein
MSVPTPDIKRGRPKTGGSGQLIGTRWHAKLIEKIDSWRADQIDEPARPEAVRRLVRLALQAEQAT